MLGVLEPFGFLWEQEHFEMSLVCIEWLLSGYLKKEEVFKTQSSYNCFINCLVSPVYQGVLISTNRDAMF
jgi:hypothetical protein